MCLRFSHLISAVKVSGRLDEPGHIYWWRGEVVRIMENADKEE
jgi:hypothetical protein